MITSPSCLDLRLFSIQHVPFGEDQVFFIYTVNTYSTIHVLKVVLHFPHNDSQPL